MSEGTPTAGVGPGGGAVSGTAASTPGGGLDPHGILMRTAELYLALLPSGHLVVFFIGGATATLADVALAALLAAGGTAWLMEVMGGGAASRTWPPARTSAEGIPEAALPARPLLGGVLLLGAFAAWVALSGLWGFHPRYALAKGLGLGALAAGVAILAWSRIGWARAADAWLVGTGAALLLGYAGWLVGPEAFRERVLYQGGALAVGGLPFPRVRGPFLHPNMLGDYLIVSAALLWARWPEYAARSRALAGVAGLTVALSLLFTASTAWLGAGVALVLLARSPWLEGGRPQRLTLRTVGAALAAVTLAGIVSPVAVATPVGVISTGGVRPAIWRQALAALADQPLLGVGAAPYLAYVPDPAGGAGPVFWDAHSAWLSVLGQFGLVGFALLFGGVGLLVWALRRTPAGRMRTALLVAAAGVGVHAVAIASEDFRHVWALLGVVAGVGVAGAAPSPGGAAEVVSGDEEAG